MMVLPTLTVAMLSVTGSLNEKNKRIHYNHS